MRIYSKTGDGGKTGLLGGGRVAKHNIRVEAYGTVDEAVAFIAFARCNARTQRTRDLLLKVEGELFKLAAELACPQPEEILKETISDDDVAWLERTIDEISGEISFKNDFVLPGPYASSSSLHMARTVVRRAERQVVGLSAQERIRPVILRYLNRLSDFLYILSLYEEMGEVIRRSVEELKDRLAGGEFCSAGKVGSMDLETSLKMIEKAEKKAKEIGRPVCVAVVDAGGGLVAFHRMDGALPVSAELAVNKAFTAVMLRMETSRLSKLARPEGELYGINTACGGRIVTFGGGIPVFYGKILAGGIGVSGGTVEEDEIIAKAGLAAVTNLGR
ncbi:cob(I)yrinic acid a,c-diamide adenosyltransferase [Thermosediminibacter oceani]|uniref:Corrinoid adenosyltransferase n=1 Tax=Thermosediminibacter oceani (strain ATCC BAA-1034 / DSM 16646 / JW/IW-1228P) TaxID=555079 RepID=D9S1Q5_THEOJ|nr:cob(I)yrinic acid a,c-diamide adenosyltransferase [Thermosediminibacter oceani]ADL07332.1 ATP/cobalamin adenosyltransferase [Thermosediminibacter oceani DSM 16646]